MVQVVWTDSGPYECRNFLSQVQLVVNHWLVNNGFSVGIGDMIESAETMGKIREKIEGIKGEFRRHISSWEKGEMKPMAGRTFQEAFEVRGNNILNQALSECGKVIRPKLKDTNRLKMMVLAGSKGSDININQVISCVGQQNVEGRRVPFGFRNRTLPHFLKDDIGPESRGFVENSYVRGLTPQEFFFHAMSGREGLIDTACKTSETGYIQRRLVKAMEDIMVKYDGTVRNSSGTVIQFLYGEDGMDATFLEQQDAPLVVASVRSSKQDDPDIVKRRKDEALKRKMSDMFELDPADPNFGDGFLTPDVISKIQRTPMIATKLRKEFQQICEMQASMTYPRPMLRKSNRSVHMPLTIARTVKNAQQRFKINQQMISSLSPDYIIDKLEESVRKLVIVKGEDALSREAQKNVTMLFTIALRTQLASKQVIKNYRLDKEAFDWVLGEVESRFRRAIVHAGESVGSIAAQSLGEPATQMTLNTFHFAGVSAKNVTLGVPRLKVCWRSLS
jgi:DNA-directed RNA polymerase II subunit RPB1